MQKIITPTSILFVCLGNICRSPAAHGVFEHLVNKANLQNQVRVDSAGTAAYHVGNKPDLRMTETANERGVDITYLRARAVNENDFETFDLILAMDEENYSDLMMQCPEHLKHRIDMYLDYATNTHLKSVPDPYYGAQSGFDQVMDLVFDVSHNLIKKINQSI